MVKALIFDLDDTLYPEQQYIESGFQLCARYIEQETGVPALGVFDSALRHAARGGAILDALAEEYNLPNGGAERLLRIYREQLPNISLDPDTVHMLSKMAKQYKFGMITDGRPEGQRNKIKALNLEHWMHTIVITDELGGPHMRKPCEAGYRKVLEQMDILPREAVYIGDNCKKDFIAPNRMGIRGIHYCGIQGQYMRENPPPDGTPSYKIQSWDELNDAIRNINDEIQGENQ